MDLVMPRKDGVAAIWEIKEEDPAARILVLTSFSEDRKAFEAVKAGALGYVLKDSFSDEVLQAIRDVYRGELSLQPGVARHPGTRPSEKLIITDLPGGWAWTFTHELKMLCPHARSLVLTNEIPGPERPGQAPVDVVLVKGCSATILFEALESLLPEQKRDPQKSPGRSRR